MAGRWMNWCLAGALIVLVACSGKKRPFADGPAAQAPGGDASTGSSTATGAGEGSDPSLPLEPSGAALGVPCARDLECASGFCVDGVCCDARCGDLCATCAAEGSPGTCSAAPTDAACGAFVCAGGTECRGYDQTQLEQNCAAFAECKAGIECAALD